MKVTTVRPRKYRAMKGDSVDEMLANVLNIKNCEIPISRIGDGWYMFGSKKIYAKIMNNKLVCRVGGGFSNMEDFIRDYAESERLKLERMDPAEIEALHSKNMDKHMIKTVPLTGRAGSPKGAGAAKGSPKAGGGTSVYMGSPRMRRNNSGSLKKLP
uniref:GAR domain-containing protein n=1 Tax=Favella ehrenbergii TaxID=182087 RepID=A0A7S3I3R1_9SPIT|mmetsp:Transcript_23099/g.30751  ORF Transcript_23099/g.30751 Transcript_23099/m.30751 type:complete len:157 (-) Transcript_23099:117-587(-)|eukprot:CAMPEP_0170471288 /NCGR_PEP_ID=MMETSP0123-20130129/13541_1 /TAXON_ID=182087 /ORGANISM="Favella ehrenbergii, Strain Fehren 1" /LENGTH=156 /DNA_ID=CAMNT_0010738853 /DNA_START=2728 /DNA_END=3201 /DNA_ORIENTATION=+